MVRLGAVMCVFLVGVLMVILFVDETEAQNWRGRTVLVRRVRTFRRRYCTCWYRWWGCSWWRSYWYTQYYYVTTCATGWTHDGDYNCIIPVCSPNCMKGGTCINPNTCKCTSSATGQFCGTLTCSYERPCYPGDCDGGTTCNCDKRFKKTNDTEGCTTFDDPSLRPFIGKSNVTLENVRRADGMTNFMFVLEGTNTSETEIVWSNQKRFNKITFEMESTFDQPEGLPLRANYVHESKMGITHSRISGRITSIPRADGNYLDDGQWRDLGWNETYSCTKNGWSKDNPAVLNAICNIVDDQFKTAIEHGDWMTLVFQTESGGSMKLIDIDNQGIPYATRYYRGFEDRKEVRFMFDFRAPMHCSEPGAYERCSDPETAVILAVDEEFTKNPIRPQWNGWVDDLSGMWQYYVEIFRLEPNLYGELTEKTPVNPEFSKTLNHDQTTIAYPEYRPSQPGMYSVLMEARDTANNSRTSRRFVLYDDRSQVDISKEQDKLLYVATAVADTGYRWQTSSTVGKFVLFTLKWDNHFVNRLHEDGKLLNHILPYPVQFKEIQDDGILFSEKYVNASLDAPVNYLPGKRTRAAIPNYHGIVKFETAYILQETDDQPPEQSWADVDPFAEERKINLSLSDGHMVRFWVRATDILGNTAMDKTLVGVDRTPPSMSQGHGTGIKHELLKNVNGSYIYTSNVQVSTSDQQSGVYRIDLEIWMTIKGVKALHEKWSVNATRGEPGGPTCYSSKTGECFIPQQSIDINNCRFIVNKTDLDLATAELEVIGVNQALLETSTTFNVGKINKLKGLEKYYAYGTPRIQATDSGLRIEWDLPKHPSCYGIADIIILLVKTDANGNRKVETFVTQGTSRHFDILGLKPETEYALQFGVRGVQDSTVDLRAKTAATFTSSGISVGATVGIVMALLIVFGITLAVLFVLMRRGVIHPRERAQQLRRAVTVKARTIRRRTHGTGFENASYDNRQSDLYIYGGKDFGGCQAWELSRDDVVFELLLKSGHFANIYSGKLRGNKSPVVLKSLKEHFTADDEMLMRAKMNFTGKVVGNHPHILQFLGGVTSDLHLGPFIIYEYCEKGTLRDFLVANKNNVTMDLQDNLFRFGFEISKGMEYLNQKSIVHRRLAARNILLNYMNEVKIYGFGPQPTEEEGGDAEPGKKERIPIKWMAPECMTSTKDATEKSDVWSYGIVIWEVFSLGETPFDNVRSRDLASKVKKGDRLQKPEQCDDTWYNMMSRCWAYEARKRPKFSQIRQELEGLFVPASGDDNYYYQR